MLLGSSMPPVHELLSLVGTTAAFAVSTFVVGGLFFRHLKRGFADVL
jgi:hypothetical protein